MGEGAINSTCRPKNRAEPLESELRSDGLCVGTKESSQQAGSLLSTGDKESSRQAGSLLTTGSGLDGSRTRVQKPIPCPSTSVGCHLTFPLPSGDRHPGGFSSFMIRPLAQSLANVVSHMVEAWVLKCECSRSDCCH